MSPLSFSSRKDMFSKGKDSPYEERHAFTRLALDVSTQYQYPLLQHEGMRFA